MKPKKFGSKGDQNILLSNGQTQGITLIVFSNLMQPQRYHSCCGWKQDRKKRKKKSFSGHCYMFVFVLRTREHNKAHRNLCLRKMMTQTRHKVT